MTWPSQSEAQTEIIERGGRVSTSIITDEEAQEILATGGFASDNDPRTIYERMAAILAALPAIGKNQRNEQQRFMFRGHDDVMKELNPLLAEHGVFVVPTVIERLAEQRTTGKGTTMYEVNLHVQYAFYGLGGDCVIGSAWGEGTDMGDKSTNKAMTMAFKNVLAQAFAISTEELSDADADTPEDTTGSRGRAPEPPEAASDIERDELVRSLLEEGIAAASIEEKFENHRRANQGVLTKKYVEDQLQASKIRLAAK